MFKAKSKELLLLLLQRNQLSLYRSNSGAITNLAFPPEIVNDLEIRDETAFINTLKGFIQLQKINQGEVVLVLDSSVYFSQEVAEPVKEEEKNSDSATEEVSPTGKVAVEEKSQLEEQKQLFVYSMPFANVFSTVVTIAKSKMIVALNRELYEPIVKVLNESKLEVTHIYPMLVVTDIFSSQGFTKETAQYLLLNREKYKTNNFLQSGKVIENITTVLPTDNKDKKRVLMLVILFLVLLALFGGVWWWSQQNSSEDGTQRRGPAQPASGVSVTTNTPVPSVAPEIVPVEVLSLQQILASSESANLAVSVIDATGDETTAKTLVTQLQELGFISVSVGETISQQSGALIVSVQPSIPVNFREALLKELKALGYSPNFQESDSQPQPIVMTVMAK